MYTTHEKIRRAFYLFPLRLKKQILQIFRKRCSHAVPVFLVGVHRSGTNMLLDVFERSPDTLIYNENNRHAFKNYRIRDRGCRLALLKHSRYPIVIFKPLNNIHEVESLIKDHPDCKILWMYRGYHDVVNSAYRKWKNSAIDAFQRAMINNDWGQIPYAVKDRGNQEIIRNYFKEAMDPHSAWALEWYLTNNIFFRYRLDEMSERVLLIRYEALVEGPSTHFMKVFDFLRITFKPDYLSRVFNSSVKKKIFPKIDPRIEALCEEMMERLDTAWEKQSKVELTVYKG